MKVQFWHHLGETFIEWFVIIYIRTFVQTYKTHIL